MIILLIALLVFIIFSVVYLFFIMPRAIDAADMESLSCDYAHRGLWNDTVPENSLMAFELAARAGAGIELDIQLTKDKRVIVFHDYTLERMCGVKGRVCDYTLAELKNLRLKGTSQHIPTFVEALRVIDSRVPVLVELKGESTDTSLCPLAARILDNYSGAFCIESFNPMLLSWFKSYRPRYARGQLVTELTGRKEGNKLLNFALSGMLLNFLSRPDFIAIDKKCQRKIAFKICVGIFRAKAFVFTVNTRGEFIACHRSGKFTIFEKIRPKF